jgi:hypothetical protein
LVESQLIEHHGIAPISSFNQTRTPSVDGNITGSDILTNWYYHYVLAKWHLTK